MTKVYSKLMTSENPNLMNYSSRNGHTIDRIVIHHNGTTNKDAAMNTWLKSGSAHTSAHYEVTPTEIIGCISESDSAWHCGGTGGRDVPKMSFPNQRSIGIENVNSSGAPTWSVDHRTVVNCAKLVADICKRYGIPCDRTHILGHREVTATDCPGGLNVDEVVSLAKQYSGQTTPSTPSNKPISTIAQEVIAGQWGNEPNRSSKLKAAGYDPKAVQAEVNEQLKPSANPAPSKPSSSGWIAQNGTFTVTTPSGIVMRSGSPSVKSNKLAVLKKGSVVKYDAFCYAQGYVWIRQPRNNGYGYIATGTAVGTKRTSYYGTFKQVSPYLTKTGKLVKYECQITLLFDQNSQTGKIASTLNWVGAFLFCENKLCVLKKLVQTKTSYTA